VRGLEWRNVSNEYAGRNPPEKPEEKVEEQLRGKNWPALRCMPIGETFERRPPLESLWLAAFFLLPP